ncbi:MAG: hypothetical protein ACHP93_05995, partial [Solirubrobacterales bacterium]
MIDVAVTSRGRVADAERDRAHERVGALDHYVSDPVLGARVVLRYEPNRRLERPARAARNEEFFRAMVRSTFGKRRKTLRNSLRYFTLPRG